MIDLHCHSNFSDGEFAPNILLDKAEKLGLDYFSITDHNNCFAYENLDTSNFSGKLIRGVEIATSFDKHIIEILGYGMRIEEINTWYRNYKTKESQYAKVAYEKLIKIFENKHIYYTKSKYTNNLIDETWTTGKVKQFIYKDLLQYEENKKIIGEDVLSSYSNFNKKGLNNPGSIIFISEYERFIKIQEAVDLIHRNGGLCFLAHIYQYNVSNHLDFLDRMRKEVNLDGVEVYHSSFTDQQIEEITKYAQENNLYKSGGSDYHGKLKPGIELGLRNNIPQNLIKPWIDKIELV